MFVRENVFATALGVVKTIISKGQNDEFGNESECRFKLEIKTNKNHILLTVIVPKEWKIDKNFIKMITPGKTMLIEGSYRETLCKDDPYNENSPTTILRTLYATNILDINTQTNLPFLRLRGVGHIVSPIYTTPKGVKFRVKVRTKKREMTFLIKSTDKDLEKILTLKRPLYFDGKYVKDQYNDLYSLYLDDVVALSSKEKRTQGKEVRDEEPQDIEND